MSRLHIHIAVSDLDQSIRFYSAVFGAQPTLSKPDYAKWQLESPAVNFAISTHGARQGVDHLGIQADSAEELAAIEQRLSAAGLASEAQLGTTCCYAQSDKHWTVDPQGIAWEAFHTLGSAPTFSAQPDQVDQSASCCAPSLTGCCS